MRRFEYDPDTGVAFELVLWLILKTEGWQDGLNEALGRRRYRMWERVADEPGYLRVWVRGA